MYLVKAVDVLVLATFEFMNDWAVAKDPSFLYEKGGL